MRVFFISLLLFGALSAQPSKLDSLEAVVKDDDKNIEAMLNLAIIYYNMVSKQENEEATERAEQLFKTILQIKKDHSEAMVYYGSLLTLKGRDAFLPWSKLSYVDEGCALMDEAVRLEPANVRLRIRRALNNIKLPDSFDRQAYYLEDFEFVRNHPAFNTFKPDFQQQILFYSAIAYQKNNEPQKSREMFQSVIDINKDSALARRASEAMQE